MKGFTLVELLGVLIILAIVMVVTVPVVQKVLRENKQSLYEKQIKNIQESARNFTAENILALNLNNNERIGITIGKLKELGYLEESAIDIKTQEQFNDNISIVIENNNNLLEYKVCIDATCNLENLNYYGV